MYVSTRHFALTDEEIIRQILPNHPKQCFESLYNRYVRKVYKRCFSMTHDSEKAEDFTQDIFLKVFDKLGAFQQMSSFSTWLYSISFNYCADQLRISKRLPFTPMDTTYGYDLAGSDEEQLLEETLWLMRLAMGTLSVNERTFLKLKYEDDLSIDEIAVLYKLNASAVKMRLKRSREKIKRLHDRLSNG
ncbi:RNA polymerase sigma factor [Spirosoma harenae]